MEINLLDQPDQSGSQSLNRLGFTAGHFALIALCLALLLLFSAVKGDLTWGMLVNAVRIHAADDSNVVTYEQALAQVRQTQNQDQDTEAATFHQLQQEQLAQVDPSYGQGEVLGASTELVSIDEMFSEQKLDAIKLSLLNQATPVLRQEYANKLKFVEAYYGTGTLLIAIGTQDRDALVKAEQSYNNLITELGQMPVPAEFERYHKLKLVYYSALMTMAHNMLNPSTDPGADVATAGTIFFSLNDKLNSMASELAAQYGVSL